MNFPKRLIRIFLNDASGHRLLIQSEQAYGQYERPVLNGVYDQNWATWYAQYAIDHAIEKCLNRQWPTEQLS